MPLKPTLSTEETTWLAKPVTPAEAELGAAVAEIPSWRAEGRSKPAERWTGETARARVGGTMGT